MNRDPSGADRVPERQPRGSDHATAADSLATACQSRYAVIRLLPRAVPSCESATRGRLPATLQLPRDFLAVKRSAPDGSRFNGSRFNGSRFKMGSRFHSPRQRRQARSLPRDLLAPPRSAPDGSRFMPDGSWSKWVAGPFAAAGPAASLATAGLARSAAIRSRWVAVQWVAVPFAAPGPGDSLATA
jgi:hypothetical protein